MLHYRFGSPDGRYIGRQGDYAVYENSIAMAPEKIPEKKHDTHKSPGEFYFYYGPASGGLIESTGFRLTTPGEMIVSVDAETSFKRRRIQVRGLNVEDALLRIERINGFHSASHSITFLKAVEDASGIEVAEDVEKARIAALELERIRSNLEVVKRLCEPAGFGVPVNQLGYLREKVSRIISSSFGHRFFFGSLGTGSVSFDPGRIVDGVKGISREFLRVFSGLQESKIFLNRLQNNGKTGTGELVGPAARAAGLEYDARIDSPSLPYGDFGFRPVIRNEGDSFGRFMVRSQEILESCELVERLGTLHGSAKMPETSRSDGEGAARIESPSGDLFYYVNLKGGDIADLWSVTPSPLNVRAFEDSMKGNIFTDFHFNWESFGIWIAEMEVELA